MLRPTVLLLAALGGTAAHAAWHFSDVTSEAGLVYQHGYGDSGFSEASENVGGVAAGDYDRDGFDDLYVVRGTVGPNLLFRNRGDGTFEERGEAAGVALTDARSSGPLFADLDGDGWLDLFVGGVDGTPPRLYRNGGDGTFTDVTAAAGLVLPLERDTVGATAADYDRDGDLDLFLTHWSKSFFQVSDTSSYHLWRNEGGGTFVDVTFEAGFVPTAPDDRFESFAANFVDLDGDGWLDLLVAADFLTSRIYRNDRDGTFTDVTDRTVITDGNGMGAAVGDYDEDGDFDWFVTSIWDPNGVAEGSWDTTGNRLYRNRGDGTFEDATEASGVRRGYWGWAATFQDLNQDGHLDIFHVNGFGDATIPATAEFFADPARLFVGDGAGGFVEQAQTAGVADTGDGRGLVAFDYDRDGDLDLFVANNGGAPRLFRNDDPPGRALAVRLLGRAPNTQAVGAVVDVSVGGVVKRRLVRAGSNYVSQDPAEVHVGLGTAAGADGIVVGWPDGSSSTVGAVAAGATAVVNEPEPDGGCGPAAAACNPGGRKKSVDCLLEWRMPGARRKIVCHEGDPACDTDPDLANGSCRIALRACTNVPDARVKRCAPQPLAAARVDAPAAGANDATDLANRAALLGAFAVLGLGPPGVVNATPDLCLPPAMVTVPLRRAPSGRLRPAVRRFRFAVASAADLEDRDTVVVQCRPPTFGDGRIARGRERCDDGNRVGGDGCDPGCRPE
jgi:cysteine-rich repeat protein